MFFENRSLNPIFGTKTFLEDIVALNEERSWFTLIVYDIDLDGTFSKAAILCVVYKLVHMADLTMAFYNIMS